MTTKKLIENKLREFVSKVIKEEFNKTKMIAYHGLSKMKADRLGYGSEISVFDTSGHWSQRVAGAYFSPFINEAKKYAKREGDKIYKVELTFNKLADRKILDEISPVKYNGETAREFLIDNGYDGVYDEPMKEIVVFYPEQIKILEIIEI